MSINIVKNGISYEIILPNCQNISCKISIGSDALEWYITLINLSKNKIIFENWADYLGYNKKSKEDLINDKYSDLLRFIKNWLQATNIKIAYDNFFFKLFKLKKCQWKINGKWSELKL